MKWLTNWFRETMRDFKTDAAVSRDMMDAAVARSVERDIKMAKTAMASNSIAPVTTIRGVSCTCGMFLEAGTMHLDGNGSDYSCWNCRRKWSVRLR